MVAGNFTGVELKLLIKETSLAELSKLIPNGVEVTRYLRAGRELHKMAVKKDYSPDHMIFINTFLLTLLPRSILFCTISHTT